jgi:hypothetical protein
MFFNRNKMNSECASHLLRRLGIASVLAGSLLLPGTSWSQGTTATLGGTVTDNTGAVIPNADVVVTNESTGDKRTAHSNGSGVFSFSALPVGNYDVTISATGFNGFAQKDIHLDPGDQRSIRGISLAAAGTTTTVEVTSAQDRINLDSGEQSSLITSSEIQHLSVEGRDVTELLKILPGFAISNGGSGNFTNVQYDPSQVNPSGALGQYAANGTPVNGQALLSDGVDITDPGNFGGSIQNINYEQVAEVKVQTGSFTADTAHGPVVINAVGKSGGDKFHGSLYTYARTYQLNSNDWIGNYTGQPRPSDRFVYPGATLGGPVLIPGTGFNHSRKLTFFVGAEDYAQRNVYAYGSAPNATLTALVPTAGMRTGDFSQAQLEQYLGPSYTIDPNGGPCTITGGGTPPDQNICRVPVTGPNGQAIANGNIAPYLDPLSKEILNGFPLPNTTSNGTYNWITTNLVNNNLWQAKGRFDLAASSKDHIFGSYGIERGASGVPQNEYYSPRGNLGGVNVPGGGLLSTIDSQIAQINYTHIFNSSLTNEFYIAGAYFKQDFVPKNFAATAGNPYQGVFNNGSTVQPTLQDYGNDGLPLLLTPDATYGGIFAEKQVHIAGDNLTKVWGKHTVRGGVFYQYDSNPQVPPFIDTNGAVNEYYIGETINDPVKGTLHSTGIVGSGNGGNYLADFAEGFIFQYSQYNIEPESNLYFNNLAGYIQDHWQLTPRMTLDGGVRFEHMQPWQDAHNVGIGVFTPQAYRNGVNAAVLPGIQWHSIDSSIPNGGRPTRWGFVEPRIGFAWDAFGSGLTVFRGGFGIYRAHDAYNDATNQNQTTLGLRNYTVSGPLLLSSVSSYQSVATQGSFVKDSNVYAFDPTDDEEPRVRTYNLAVDQRLPGKMLLEVAYVGNSSDKLMNDGSTQNTSLDNINSLPIGSLFGAQPSTRPDLAGSDPCYSPGRYYPVLPPAAPAVNCSTGSLSQGVIDSYKPYPLYNHVYVPEHNTYSNYNGLQVALARQTGHATYNVNYTWSKALGILGMGGSSTYSYPGDPFNYRNDYSYMPFDRRHIFNAAYSYVFGDIVHNRWAGGVANGWELSGITNYQSGSDLQSIISSNFGVNGNIVVPAGTTATVATNPSNTSTCASTSTTATCTFGISSTDILGTPDVNLQPTVIGNPQAVSRKQHQFINAAAFSLPALGTNGPYKYGYLPGPGFFDTDLTAAKRFKVTEGSSIQLKIAAFNVINHGNNTFSSVNVSNYTMDINETNNGGALNQALQSSTVSNGAPGVNQFGAAPLRTGRRVTELSLRYDF